MSKLLDGLFPKTQRIDDIMAYNRQAENPTPARPTTFWRIRSTSTHRL